MNNEFTTSELTEFLNEINEDIKLEFGNIVAADGELKFNEIKHRLLELEIIKKKAKSG